MMRFFPSSERFQFTHPGKGATVVSHEGGDVVDVSIHAPWEGCDAILRIIEHEEWYVSIHAPWEGCDLEVITHIGEDIGFNSRTLGRVRR